MEFIDLRSQYLSLKLSIDARIQKVLEHGQYINGPEISELENALCDYSGAKHCVTCGNGTDALQLALLALDIGPGDAVFTTSFSFFATAEVISLVGAKPIFVDIDENTFNICPSKLEEAIKGYKGKEVPRAIITVDLFGLPADYPQIKTIANKYQLKIIEDAAQGFGGKIGNQYAGTFGDISTTSFFPAKPLGCYGDGGALFTSSEEIALKLSSLKQHGQGSNKYHNVRIGLNSRLDTLQAAILIEKLNRLEEEIEKRNKNADMYNSLLSSFKNIDCPDTPAGFRSSWAQYTIKVSNRDDVSQALKNSGIPSQVYYPIPLHQQEAFNQDFFNSHLPVAEKASKRVLSLPIHAYLSSEDVHRVVEELQSISSKES